jgi:RHS repeat-associated protein
LLTTVGVGNRVYDYDANGNLGRVTTRNARGIEYGYDALNRRVSETWTGYEGNGYEATYTYDLVGNLLTASDSQGYVSTIITSSIETAYDSLNRPRSVTQDATHTPESILVYAYDANGNRTRTDMTVNGHYDVTNAYTFDALNRTTLIRQFDANDPTGSSSVHAKAVKFAYGIDGQLKEQQRFENYHADPNGYVLAEIVSKTDFVRDPQTGRLANLVHYGVTGTPEARYLTFLTSYSFTYDANSRIDDFITTEYASGVQTEQTVRLDHDHDWMGQVTQVRTYVGTDLTNTKNFDYDTNGNPSGANLGPHNRLLDDGKYTYEYDNEGNRTRREAKTADPLTSRKEIQEYTWDNRNRLVSVQVSYDDGTPGPLVTFEYDVFDRRIVKNVSLGGSTTSSRYVYDGDHVALLAIGGDEIDRRYLWAPGVDQLLADERVQANAPVGTPPTVLWNLADHQGTVRDIYRQMDNGDYEIIQEVSYDAFGKPNYNVFDVRFAYAGQEFDEETGLQYSRARYYDSAAGRFISQDPIGFGGGDTNLYRRVGNSPINATDPSGNEPVALTTVAVGAILTYLATQATIAAVETSIEVGLTGAFGGEVTAVGTLGKFATNFGINAATGGIGTKGKWVFRAAAYATRQGIDIAGTTAYDVWNGQDFANSLAWNTIGSVGGEALGRLAIGGAKAFNRSFEIYATAGSRGAVYANSGFGLGRLTDLRIRRRGVGIDAPKTGASRALPIIDSSFTPKASLPELVIEQANRRGFATATDDALFWSGLGRGRAGVIRSQEFARVNGGTTLELTSGGRYLDDLNLFGADSPLTIAEAMQVWGNASRQFARGASGQARAVTGQVRPSSFWRTVELPELLSNPRVTGIDELPLLPRIGIGGGR